MLSSVDTLSFYNPQLDRKTGGIPIPSLTLIEGVNDSGKSVLAQQLIYGQIKNGKKVLYISSDAEPKIVLSNMSKLNMDIKMEYVLGLIKIIHIDVFETTWDREKSKYYLLTLINYIQNIIEDIQIIILDSITYLLKNADDSDIINFFSKCKNLTDIQKINFVISIHPYAIESDLYRRICEICDGYIKLEKKTFRGKQALTLNVIKLKGASLSNDNMISFEIINNKGIKVLPFTSTKG